MDGKNASGSRVSLLNEDGASTRVLSYRTRLPSPPTQPHIFSYPSPPSDSPPTPPLLRSDSSDSSSSSDSAAMQTPSPVTPVYSCPGDYIYPLPSSLKLCRQSSDFFDGRGALVVRSPYEPVSGNWADCNSAQQAPESGALSTSANRSKKNSYPCPMAKQYACNDYFTTSGHAARHAKKHTGKKDAVCPDCMKAFTRKDNMEQHRRTHQTGRNATKVGEDRTKKSSKQQMKRPKPAPIQASLSPLPLVDPALCSSRSAYPVALHNHYSFETAYPQRSPYPSPPDAPRRHYSMSSDSFGLHTLAYAASGEKRKIDAVV
jgi:hypothetical protein